MAHSSSDSRLHFDTAKIISVVSYLTIIGWLFAIIAYGKYRSSFASFHLRQSLGLIVTAALLSFIPLIGWLINVVLLVAWVAAIYHAALGERYCIPVVGFFYQEQLEFIR